MQKDTAFMQGSLAAAHLVSGPRQELGDMSKAAGGQKETSDTTSNRLDVLSLEAAPPLSLQIPCYNLKCRPAGTPSAVSQQQYSARRRLT